MRKSDLFHHKTIKKLREQTDLTSKQKEASGLWLSYLSAGDLKDEKRNYMKFGRVILEDILGFPQVEIGHEEDNVDFSFNNPAGKKVLCIECKGTGTEPDELQHRDKKAQETPLTQTWDYVSNTGSAYGICTNYKEFVLMTRADYPALHWFDFESIRENRDEKLKEFVGIFSKERLIDDGGSVEVLHKNSVNEEEEFTAEFYKLFHQTRLMMIRAFQEKEGVTKDEAIKYAQLYLNRLIFIFFAEDNKLLEKKLFMERVVKSLNSNVSEVSKMISEQILDLFKIMDEGSDMLGIVGFGGGLFQERIPSKIHFLDLRDKKFFSDIISEIKLKKINPDNTIQSLINKVRKLNPIIKNLLMMNSFDFTTDLNVNILGHIFEQSISDLEELKGGKVSKRKKDGAYYTPEYLTDYICRNTIIPYLSKSGASSIRELIVEYKDNIEELEKKFREIKILDPACGSGAFLIKAIDILLEIHKEILAVKMFLYPERYSENDQTKMDKWNEESEAKKIIENNIYGVDINPESAGVTKLALFLKIASRGKKLIELTNNIKVGNSLISDKSIDKMAFNWELEFPQIFCEENGNKKIDGGFSCIIGNPPWERPIIEDKEFFGSSTPEIANAKSSATRKKLINKLEMTDPELYNEYTEKKKSVAQQIEYLTNSKKFQLSAVGDINFYAIFLELARNFLRKNGRCGLVVPTGIITDLTYQEFFQELISSSSLVACHDFTNKQKIFKDVASNMRFSLVLLRNSDIVESKFSISVLNESIDTLLNNEKTYFLSKDEINLFNPNSKTCPMFPSTNDYEICKRIYEKNPILINENTGQESNTWNFEYWRMFDMSNDSNLFKRKEELVSTGFTLKKDNWFVRNDIKLVPLYESKLFKSYDHRHGSFKDVSIERRFGVKAEPNHPTNKQKGDTLYEIEPRYWLKFKDVDDRLKRKNVKDECFFAFRNICRTFNDSRTAIGTIIPFSAVGHSAAVLLFRDKDSTMRNKKMILFSCIFSSLVFDYLVRQKMSGINLSKFILIQIASPSPKSFKSLKLTYNNITKTAEEWCIEQASRVLPVSQKLVKIFKNLSNKPVKWDEDDRFEKICFIDAIVAHTYGLNRKDYEYILNQFPILCRQQKEKYGKFLSLEMGLEFFDALEEDSE